MKKERNYGLDFAKAIFSIVIILYHYNYYCLSWENEFLFRGGYICVEYFFVFSGYYLYDSLNKSESFIIFFKGRLKSLYPMYLLALIFGLVVNIRQFFGDCSFITVVKNTFGLLEQVFLIQDWGLLRIGVDFNRVTWYISSLMLSSIIFYILHKVFAEKLLISVVSITTASLLILAIVYGTTHKHNFIFGHIPVGTIRAIAGMGIGVVVRDRHAVLEKLFVGRKQTATLYYYILILFAICSMLICKDNVLDFISYPIAAGLLITSPFVSLKLPIKTYYGKFSYAVYLVHINVLNLLIKLGMQKLAIFICSSFALASILIFADMRSSNRLKRWLNL